MPFYCPALAFYRYLFYNRTTMTSSIRKTGETIKNSPFFKGQVLFDYALAPLTTMKVGGKAAVFVEPEDIPSAVFALSEFAKLKQNPLF